MYTLTVAPIARGVLHGALTYFAKDRPVPGSLIMVPLRNREIPALVLEVSDAALSKGSLKSSDFTIRKIGRVTPRTFWDEAFVSAAKYTAHVSAQNFGETLLALTPSAVLAAYIDHAIPEPEHAAHESSSHTHVSALQATTEERMESYQRLIRESFVQGQSVYVCLPSEIDVERVGKILSRGIEEYAYTFSSTMSKKSVLTKWERARREPHAILVVGTTQYLALPRRFSTIVIEEEHARTWKTISRPHLDLRVFIEAYARDIGAHLILGAPLLTPETHKRIKELSVREFGRIFSRAHRNATRPPLETRIVDPKKEEVLIRERTGERIFQIITDSAESIIQSAGERKETVFLLSARTGLSPITRCSDCGTIVTCEHCGNPLAIHTKKDGSHIFSCHACGALRTPEQGLHEECPNCKSWRLEGFGVGTERISALISEKFPHRKLFVFDGIHVKTPAQAKRLMAEFYMRGSQGEAPILIGTPMAIPYMSEVDHTIVVSIDSLFAIPDFRMNERIYTLVLSLREKTERTLIVQTRGADTSLFESALAGNLSDFTERELTLRKTFSYPPYSIIVKVTLHAPKHQIEEEMHRFQEYVHEYAPQIPRVINKTPEGTYRMHALIKLPLDVEDKKEALLRKLESLPRHFMVEINPDSLL